MWKFKKIYDSIVLFSLHFSKIKYLYYIYIFISIVNNLSEFILNLIPIIKNKLKIFLKKNDKK